MGWISSQDSSREWIHTDTHPGRKKKKKKAIGKYWERVINTVLELAQATIFGGERGVYNDNDRRRKSLMSYLRGKDFVLDFREKEIE